MFLLILVYPIRFLGNFDVAKTIDTGTPGPVGVAVLVNLILLEVFVVPHSVMDALVSSGGGPSSYPNHWMSTRTYREGYWAVLSGV